MSVINRGPVTILWDYENCPAPKRGTSRGLSGTVIVKRLRDNFDKLGPIKEVKAFGNVSTIPPELREELQTSAVTVIDAISVNKRKDLVDKMIFTHMLCFALDNPPPATIVLIAGDVDYALPLAALSLRHYFIVLVLPEGTVSEKLIGIADQVFYWDDILFPERMTACSTTTSEDGDDDQPVSLVLPSKRIITALPTTSSSETSSTCDDDDQLSEDDEEEVDTNDRRISAEAAQLHLRDLFRILLTLWQLGDKNPYVSKVGNRLKQKFPKIFKRKETVPQLINLAIEQGLLEIGGQDPGWYCRFVPGKLQTYIETSSKQR